MKNVGRTFSSSLHSFKVNLIQRKCQRVAFANKISISSYSSIIDPQSSKLMFMDDIHSNILRKYRGRWIKCKRTFYYKNVSIHKTAIVTQRRLFCNKSLISQYLAFFHPTSLRFEYLCEFDRIPFENIMKRGKIAMKNDARLYFKFTIFLQTNVKEWLFVIEFQFHPIPPILTHRPQNKCSWVIFTLIFSKTSWKVDKVPL